MKYAVDEIIDNIVILENIKTGEKKEVDIKKMPNNICEGNIVLENIDYKLDKNEEILRRERIQKKLDKLKK